MPRVALWSIVLVAAACGGKTPPMSSEPLGTTHVPPADAAPDAPPPPPPDVAPAPVEAAPDSEPATPVTFELQNDGDRDVVFAIDKGWQPVLFAFTGVPPKAQSVVLFPLACTASCEAPPDERCPSCRAEVDPARVRASEREETRREVATPGTMVTVPWPGEIYVYEKAQGTKKKCKCWRSVEPAPGEYTFKACGLRRSTEAGKHSTPVCAEKKVRLPFESVPATVRLSFSK